MSRRVIYKALVGLVAIGTLAWGGTALAITGASTAAVPPQTPAVVQTSPSDTSQPVPVQAAAPSTGSETTAPTQVDADSVQQQSGADDATEVSAPEAQESDAAGAAETEQSGADGPGGHADELPASATNINPSPDHQFQGEE
jgi:hypothetical protein